MTYEQRLRAIGRLIDLQNLRSVCILEYADGAVVTGLAKPTGWEQSALDVASLDLSDEQIARAVVEIEQEEPDRHWLGAMLKR